jgi:hypothetical protein
VEQVGVDRFAEAYVTTALGVGAIHTLAAKALER